MHLGQYRILSPVGQEPPQGRAADLLDRRTQTAPRQAFTQKPAQGGNHAHQRAARMARSAFRWWFAGHDQFRNQVQKSEIQHVLPYPTLRYGKWKHRFQRNYATTGNSENRVLSSCHYISKNNANMYRSFLNHSAPRVLQEAHTSLTISTYSGPEPRNAFRTECPPKLRISSAISLWYLVWSGLWSLN